MPFSRKFTNIDYKKMMTRKFLKLFLIFNGLQIGVLLLILTKSLMFPPNFEPKKQLITRFLLTDYCFSTESRHTRHYLFPEMIAPFQDLAGWHEHFPSSSFFPPPKLDKKK